MTDTTRMLKLQYSNSMDLYYEIAEKDKRIAELEAQVAELIAALKEELCVKKYAIKRLTEMKLMNMVKLEKQ